MLPLITEPSSCIITKRRRTQQLQLLLLERWTRCWDLEPVSTAPDKVVLAFRLESVEKFKRNLHIFLNSSVSSFFRGMQKLHKELFCAPRVAHSRPVLCTTRKYADGNVNYTCFGAQSSSPLHVDKWRCEEARLQVLLSPHSVTLCTHKHIGSVIKASHTRLAYTTESLNFSSSPLSRITSTQKLFFSFLVARLPCSVFFFSAFYDFVAHTSSVAMRRERKSEWKRKIRGRANRRVLSVFSILPDVKRS